MQIHQDLDPMLSGIRKDPIEIRTVPCGRDRLQHPHPFGMIAIGGGTLGIRNPIPIPTPSRTAFGENDLDVTIQRFFRQHHKNNSKNAGNDIQKQPDGMFIFVLNMIYYCIIFIYFLF